MNPSTDISGLVSTARQAIARKDIGTLARTADAILNINPLSDEGLYLMGKAAFLQKDMTRAERSLRQAFDVNPKRHDAAIELAHIFSRSRRNGEALSLINAAIPLIQNSPKYLDLAGTILVEIGLSDQAFPLYKRANALQPNAPILQANLANCAVYVGEFELAKSLFEQLISANPGHRQNHFHYSKLVTAQDKEHIQVMEAQLADPKVPENRNTPLLFATAKEYEDLGDFETAFSYYQRGNENVSRLINYDPKPDLELLDFIRASCHASWFKSGAAPAGLASFTTPIFIVGLPRTGTTLVERILSNHSCINSLGETLFIPNCAAGLVSEKLGRASSIYTPEAYGHFLDLCDALPELYSSQINYRLGTAPYFIEKLPLNYLFVGPLAKAWPEAKFVVLNRGLMDTGFSLFKQVFTWAYKFSYDLENIGNYVLAYKRLMAHWETLLGDRLIEVEYEALTQNPEQEIRTLLESLSIPFETGCINFETNQVASTTASTVQVRSGMSTASVGRWRNYESQLEPMRQIFEKHGLKA